MINRRHNGDTTNKYGATQRGEYSHPKKPLDFIWRISPASVPVRGYSSFQPGSGRNIRNRPPIFAIVRGVGDTMAIRSGGVV